MANRYTAVLQTIPFTAVIDTAATVVIYNKLDLEMTTRIDIKRKRGDDRQLPFQVQDETGEVVDITGWTFLLTVTSISAPADGSSQQFQLTGSIEEAVNGLVNFPDTVGNDMRDQAAGKYFYDMQATDNNSEIITLAEGRFTLVQDRTK